MVIEQDQGTARVALEDIAFMLIEHPQTTISVQLLSACAARQVAVITVGQDYHPNGQLISHLPHSRVGKILGLQLALGAPAKKRIWQQIIRRKIRNQAAVLDHFDKSGEAARLRALSDEVRSGDPDNRESEAALTYFRALFDHSFTRREERFYNAAFNYGYSVVRSALARALVRYGFLTALGVHHANEQNAFNLADDLIEPYRPLLDHHVLSHFPSEPQSRLLPEHKAHLVAFLHRDVTVDGLEGETTVLSAADQTVMSLQGRLLRDRDDLSLPQFSGP